MHPKTVDPNYPPLRLAQVNTLGPHIADIANPNSGLQRGEDASLLELHFGNIGGLRYGDVSSASVDTTLAAPAVLALQAGQAAQQERQGQQEGQQQGQRQGHMVQQGQQAAGPKLLQPLAFGKPKAAPAKVTGGKHKWVYKVIHR